MFYSALPLPELDTLADHEQATSRCVVGSADGLAHTRKRRKREPPVFCPRLHFEFAHRSRWRSESAIAEEVLTRRKAKPIAQADIEIQVREDEDRQVRKFQELRCGAPRTADRDADQRAHDTHSSRDKKGSCKAQGMDVFRSLWSDVGTCNF